MQYLSRTVTKTVSGGGSFEITAEMGIVKVSILGVDADDVTVVSSQIISTSAGVVGQDSFTLNNTYPALTIVADPGRVLYGITITSATGTAYIIIS